MVFKTITELFNGIQKINQRSKISQSLSQLFMDASSEEIEIIVNLSLGQLYPVFHKNNFLIGQKLIITMLTNLLGETTEMVIIMTDNLTNIYDALINRSICVDHGYTVIDVFQRLVGLEKITGDGSVEKRIELLTNLIRSVDARSADLLIRIILGTLRLGFSHMTIIDALAYLYDDKKKIRTKIEHAYNISADLGMIAKRLSQEGVSALDRIQITIGVPIVPAAAERVKTLGEIIKRINPVIVQPKYDGMRVQIHCEWNKKNAPTIVMFSRHLHTISNMFPEFLKVLTSYSGQWQTIIFEGEVIAHDPNTGMILPFQEMVKRKRKYNIDAMMSEIPLTMIAFDILYGDGKSFLEAHHQERYDALKNFIVSLNNQDAITITSEIIVHNEKALSDYFYEQIEKGLEGIIAKRLDVKYTPGKRNFNWIKFKKSNNGSLDDTIDAVIIGYYYGKGKRFSFGIGALLIAVFNSDNNSFETIAKIGTGLADDEWIELKKLLDLEKSSEKPSSIFCNNQLAPDVWIQPSIVIMVKADEVTLSPIHTAGKKEGTGYGYALRFPRFVTIVNDKGPYQSTTVAEIQQLYEIQKKRTNKKYSVNKDSKS